MQCTDVSKCELTLCQTVMPAVSQLRISCVFTICLQHTSGGHHKTLPPCCAWCFPSPEEPQRRAWVAYIFADLPLHVELVIISKQFHVVDEKHKAWRPSCSLQWWGHALL